MKREKARRYLKRLPLLLALLLPVACSEESLDLFFDIPAPTPEELAAEARAEAEAARAARAEARGTSAAEIDEEEREPPAIEASLKWSQVESVLPKDSLDQVDWVEALRQDLIRPRHAIKGGKPSNIILFGFDFFLSGEDPDFEAYFPHSAHTQWLTCDSCHPKIFRSRGTQMTMDDIMEGKYCGICHGRVAFGLEACDRCHTAMAEE